MFDWQDTTACWLLGEDSSHRLYSVFSPTHTEKLSGRLETGSCSGRQKNANFRSVPREKAATSRWPVGFTVFISEF